MGNTLAASPKPESPTDAKAAPHSTSMRFGKLVTIHLLMLHNWSRSRRDVGVMYGVLARQVLSRYRQQNKVEPLGKAN
jgi:hypothetical protein